MDCSPPVSSVHGILQAGILQWVAISSFKGSALVAQTLKNLPAMRETWVPSLGWKDPLEKGMATHSVFLPGESYGQRSLVGYSPWGCKESDTTEMTEHITGEKLS